MFLLITYSQCYAYSFHFNCYTSLVIQVGKVFSDLGRVLQNSPLKQRKRRRRFVELFISSSLEIVQGMESAAHKSLMLQHDDNNNISNNNSSSIGTKKKQKKVFNRSHCSRQELSLIKRCSFVYCANEFVPAYFRTVSRSLSLLDTTASFSVNKCEVL